MKTANIHPFSTAADGSTIIDAESAAKSRYTNTENGWIGDGQSAKYCREEQWRILAYYQ
jgi:hypothetical protein